MGELDAIDLEILDMLQNGFPLAVQPFREMGDRLQIDEEQVISRIGAMKASGLIRRIGGIIDSRKMGFYSSLCAVAVPEARINETAELINALPGVTHNYLREHEMNMWFTLTMPSREQLAEKISELEFILGLKIISMPAQEVYKIKVAFDMGSSK